MDITEVQLVLDKMYKNYPRMEEKLRFDASISRHESFDTELIRFLN